MPQDTTILRQIYDYANRPNPYPLWARLRQTPVSFQEDGPDEAGTYVVSTYREIVALLHDPRLSSDLRHSTQSGGRLQNAFGPYAFLALIALDPPEHDRLLALAMRHFGPPERPAYLDHCDRRSSASSRRCWTRCRASASSISSTTSPIRCR